MANVANMANMANMANVEVPPAPERGIISMMLDYIFSSQGDQAALKEKEEMFETVTLMVRTLSSGSD